ncbi:unnamed protein product [Blepharisma stoltei]|uniref:Glutathione peroxidase n=1 Tax=Blepharisma stoltei TaxID=1481888 RepID=A0AAU9IQ69_9CILI|nr:unnamed protein product [Blepharisma stoltei]
MGLSNSKKDSMLRKTIYDFIVNDIDEKPIKLSNYQGKVLIIVNVACSCPLTRRNYNQLNQLYSKYNEKGLEILAFPCNQFYNQEAGSNEEIKDYVKNDLKAKFNLFSKINVNGKNACDLYIYLRFKSSLAGKNIDMNFGKFLIDRQGNVINYYKSNQDPLSFENDILSLLNQ